MYDNMTYKPILFSIFKKYIAKDKYKNSLFPFKRKIQEKSILTDTYTPLTVE